MDVFVLQIFEQLVQISKLNPKLLDFYAKREA